MTEQLAKEYEEYKAQGRIWGGVPQESVELHFKRGLGTLFVVQAFNN